MSELDNTMRDLLNKVSKTTTEEQLQAATIGTLAPLNGPIHIVDYTPEWPQIFEYKARQIQAILGDRMLLLEHVGSTSVPGLAAKPIIDMLLVVADSADEPAYVPALEAAGYALRIREPAWYEHRMFKGSDPAINLHIFSPAHFLTGLPRDRPHAPLPQLVTEQHIRSPALRAHQTGACTSGLAVHPKLRRCENGGR